VGLINDDVNHTGDATLLRKVNESAVLNQIRRCGPITRSDVIRRLHLNLLTVTRIANELLNASLIVEAGSVGSSGDRRPGLLAFNFDRTSPSVSIWNTNRRSARY
jgi:N-acetylglucosamine repressor